MIPKVSEPIDFSVLALLEEYSSAEDDLIATLITDYKKDYLSLLATLTQAAAANNLQDFNDTAHGLKSISASLGMARVSQVCEGFEGLKSFSSKEAKQIQSLRIEIENALQMLTDRRSSKV